MTTHWTLFFTKLDEKLNQPRFFLTMNSHVAARDRARLLIYKKKTKNNKKKKQADKAGQ